MNKFNVELTSREIAIISHFLLSAEIYENLKDLKGEIDGILQKLLK